MAWHSKQQQTRGAHAQEHPAPAPVHSKLQPQTGTSAHQAYRSVEHTQMPSGYFEVAPKAPDLDTSTHDADSSDVARYSRSAAKRYTRAQRKGSSARNSAQRQGVSPSAAQQDLTSTYQSAAFQTHASPEQLKQRASKRRLWRVVLLISAVVFIAALTALGAIVYQYFAQQNAYNSLEQYVTVEDGQTLALADLHVDWDSLQAINPDIVAWIYVPNSPINYPVVQGSDNNEYLHKAFDGSTGWLASAGTIFLDASNNASLLDHNNVLYGHHMRDGSMFAAIADWTDQSEFLAHRDLYVLTPAGNYRCKTFALVITTGSDSVVQTSFSSDDNYRTYIQDKLDRSVVSQSGEVFTVEDIQQSFILSTCEYTQNDGRAVLCATVVETTIANDPYVAASEEGTTGLSTNQDAEVGRTNKEAA